MNYSKYLDLIKNTNNWPLLGGSTPHFPAKYQNLLAVSYEPIESRQDITNQNLRDMLTHEMGFESCEFTMGASQAFFQILFYFSQYYNSIAIERPYYEPYASLAKYLGLKVETFDRDKRINFDKLKLVKKPKIAILSNPHFFHGNLLSDDEIKELSRHFDYVILDEVFMAQFSPENHFCSSYKAKNVIRINSLSKSFGLSSLRFGWISGSQKIVSSLKKMSYYLQVDIPTLSQRTAYNVLVNRDIILNEMKAAQYENRLLIKKIRSNNELLFSHNFDSGHFGSIKFSNPVPGNFSMLNSSHFGKKGYYRFRIDAQTEILRNTFSEMRIG